MFANGAQAVDGNSSRRIEANQFTFYMATTRSQEIRVGVVTLLAILIAIGGIIWGKSVAVGVGSRGLRVALPNAEGIEPGAPVMILGVRKGSVTGISIVRGEVEAAIGMDPDVHLRKDATAKVGMLELMGGKKIDVDPGVSEAPLPDNAIIPGTSATDISQLLSGGGDAEKSLNRIMSGLDSTLQSVRQLVTDPALQQSLRNSVSNLESASNGANQLVIRNRADVEQSVRNLADLSRDLKVLVAKTSTGLDRTMGTVNDVGADTRRLVASADSVVATADSLVRKLDNLVRDIKEGGGVASKLLYDKQFAAELESTIKTLNFFIENAEKHGIKLNIGLGSR